MRSASPQASSPRRSGLRYTCVKLIREGSRKRSAMLGEERLQLGLGRLGRLGDVLADELHLLAQPAADHDVVALEAERQGLAIEDLLLDVVLDQAVELRLGRRPAPGALEQLGQVLDLRCADHDPVRPLLGRLADHAEQHEQPGAQHQEMEQRLAQDLLQCGHRTPQPAGVYQIGEVYARSWMLVAATSAGRSTPKNLAS